MVKGLVFDIRRYSVHDGPGIRTTVFLKGCPLNCLWCHNPEGIESRPQKIVRTRKLNGREKRYEETIGKWMTPEEVMEPVLKDRIFYEESNGGVTFSGGEPMMQADFLLNMLSACSKEELHTAVDTSGHIQTGTFLKIAEKTDLLLFDIKTTDKEKHIKYTGEDNELIFKNLLSLPAGGPEILIRIPVIPGFNSQPGQIEAILDKLRGVKASVKRIDLLPYHLLGRQKYEALGRKTPPEFKPEIKQDTMKILISTISDRGYKVKTGG